MLRWKKMIRNFFCSPYGMSEAQGGVAQLAEKSKLIGESLYKMLSKRGNPECRSLDALLHALGFRLATASSRWTHSRFCHSNRGWGQPALPHAQRMAWRKRDAVWPEARTCLALIQRSRLALIQRTDAPKLAAAFERLGRTDS